MLGYRQISKEEFYRLGAFADSRLTRKDVSNDPYVPKWTYWQRID